jgi:hypothetical protein
MTKTRCALLQLAKCKGEYGKIKQVASNLEEEYAAVQRLHENEDCKASDNAAAAANLQAHLRTLLPVDDQRANATKEEVASLDEATLHAVSLQYVFSSAQALMNEFVWCMFTS